MRKDGNSRLFYCSKKGEIVRKIKQVKRLFSFVLALLMLFVLVPTHKTKAASETLYEGKHLPLYAQHTYPTGIYYDGVTLDNQRIYGYQLPNLKISGGNYSGRTAFCINRVRVVRHGAKLTSTNLADRIYKLYRKKWSKEQANVVAKKLGYAATYGWEMSDKTQIDQMATQLLVYEYLGYRLNYATPNSTYKKVKARMNEIEWLINNRTTKASFNGTVLNLKPYETKTLTDKNGVWKYYMKAEKWVKNQPWKYKGVIYTWDGNNSITVQATPEAMGKTQKINFYNMPTGKTYKTPFAWVGNTQDMVTAGGSDPATSTITVNVIRDSNIWIQKRDLLESSESINIAGGKFELICRELDAPDPTGKIKVGKVIENLSPRQKGDGWMKTVSKLTNGVYELREIQAPNNYKKNPKSIMFKLNVGADGSIKISHRDKYLEWTNYTQAMEQLNAEVDKFNKLIKSENYDRKPQEYFKVNPEKENSSYAYFYDQPFIGRFEITKTLVNGDQKTPEKGIVFNVYTNDRNQTLVDTIKTNAKGKGTSKLLPYGKYTIKQDAKSTPVGVTVAEPVNKNLNTDNEVNKINFTNEVVKSKVTIRKADITTEKITAELAGAEFDVILKKLVYPANGYTEGEVVDHVVIGKDGLAETKELPLGTYQLKETKAPAGYTLNPEITEFEITTTEDRKHISLHKIHNPWRKVLESLNSRVNDFNALIKEKGAKREPMKLFDTFKESEKSWQIYAYDHLSLGRIEINKTYDGSDTYLQDSYKENGIVFEVYKGDTLVDTLETNKDGYATSKLLPLGTYKIHQKTSPVGVLKVDDFNVTIKADGEVVTSNLQNKPQVTKLKIVKVDSETQKKIVLAHATFELLDSKKQVISMQNADGERVSQFTTDENGEITFPENLIFGTYYLREVESPEGYYLAENAKPIEITIDGTYTVVEAKVKEVKVENTPQKGQLELAKQGEVLTDLTTETVEIADKQYEVTKPVFTLGYVKGAVYSLKAAEDIIGKDGTVFYKKGTEVEQLTTIDKAPIKFREVPLGKYTVEEVSAPYGYALDNTVYPIEFSLDSSHIRLDLKQQSVADERKHISVRLSKKLFEEAKWHDYHETAPDKTVFAIFNKNEIKQNGITIDKDTMLGVSGLDAALSLKFDLDFESDYYLKELVTGTEYNLADNVEIKATFSADPVEVDSEFTVEPIENKLIRGSIELVKVESKNADESEFESKPLEGAVFKLYVVNKKGDIELGVYTTDENGKINVGDLEVGDYYLKEITPPKGYKLDETPIKLTVDSEKLVSAIAENVKTETFISKTGITGENELKGALLKVVDKDGKVIDEWTSGDAPHIIKGLVAGEKYTLVEEQAPAGYALSTAIEFTVDEKGEATHVHMVNHQTKVKITKTDITSGKPVEGATIEIYDSKGKLVSTSVTDENGVTEIVGLVAGETYTFKEKVHPKGYILNTESFKFTIDKDGKITGQTTFSDEPTALKIKKVDMKGNPLAGAEFNLFFKNGDKVRFNLENGIYVANANGSLDTLTSDKNGLIEVRYLPQGEYEVKETKAPDGYMLNKQAFNVVIGEENGVSKPAEITIQNEEVPVLPSTGLKGASIPMLALGIMLITTLLGVTAYKLKKQR